MRFSELLQSELAGIPGEQQSVAARLFPVAIENSHFRLWTMRDVVPEKGRRLVIGVATYAPADLALLDHIEERLSEKPDSMAVEVFNLLDCTNQRDVHIRIPEIVRVHQTPIVGLWEDGEFRQSEQGSKARDLIQKIFF